MEFQIQRIEQDLQYLCSPELAGRLSGTRGARLAANYLATSLQSLGFIPAGENGFFSTVQVPASRLVGPPQLRIGNLTFDHRIDFAEMSPYSGGGVVSVELLIVRDGDDIPSDDFTNKLVLLPERPKNLDVKSTIETAVHLGVSALLIESGEPKWFHKTVFGSDKNHIPVLRLRRSIIEKILNQNHKHVYLELPLVSSTLPCQNVLGLLRGKDQTQTLVLTAHYDHVADDPEGLRFPGTIDNASGVASKLELSRLLSSRDELPFNILVAFLTGEESGLWGARQLVSNPPIPFSAVINLDCLGFEPELVALRTGHKESTDWLTELASGVISRKGIEVSWIAGGDDSVAFKEKGIPTIGLGQKPTLSDFINIHTPDDHLNNIHIRPIVQGMEVLTEITSRLLSL